MTEPVTITLAGESYTIERLTLRQLRALAIGISLPDDPDPQTSAARNFDRTVAIIVAGLSKKYPELTADALLDKPIARAELNKAADQILVLSGLVTLPAAGTPPGEGAAGAA